jgi:hypothetical protein
MIYVRKYWVAGGFNWTVGRFTGEATVCIVSAHRVATL